jgi:phenylalanyl-tRNA synthetase alpha chain
MSNSPQTPVGESDGEPRPAALGYTATQTQRLRELGVPPKDLRARFTDDHARDDAFAELERRWTRTGRARLGALREETRETQLAQLTRVLASAVRDAGFVQVVTPTIISREALEKMGISPSDPLAEQIFWLADDRCLRPMLAPNLYTLMRKLARFWRQPFGLFEVGSCFRRDTKGASHLNEFTMMNLVELGTPMERRDERLRELAALVMGAARVTNYELVHKPSVVYGDTVDIVAGPITAGERLEVCSAAMGPHPLDDAWGITDPWVGLGFGLERLLVAREGYPNIERAGRSLSYIDGVRLNI